LINRLIESGFVYGFGSGEESIFGSGGREILWTPTMLKAFSNFKVLNIGAGVLHCIFQIERKETKND
jgi:hypothetical protein